MDDNFPNADLFQVEAILYYLEEIAVFFTTGATPTEYSATQKRHLVTRAAYYKLRSGRLYKMGSYVRLLHGFLDHE